MYCRHCNARGTLHPPSGFLLSWAHVEEGATPELRGCANEEATQIAVEQVKLFVPRDETPRAAPRPGLFKRLFGWLVK